MVSVNTTPVAGSDAGARSQAAEVQARQRPTAEGRDSGLRTRYAEVGAGQRAEQPARAPTPEREVLPGGEGGVTTPDPYAVLLSRIDHAPPDKPVERTLIERLATLLGERLAGLSARTRRNLLALPELQALGVEALPRLPQAVATRLQETDGRTPVLALLREPSFAAAIKAEPLAVTYGPHGALHAG